MDKNKNEWNSLHGAAVVGNVTEIESLLSRGFPIDSRAPDCSTPLMLAAGFGKLQAVEYLLEKGADPLLESDNGSNLLHHASQGGNPDIIKLMLSHVPSIDAINNQGVTALMRAAHFQKLQAVEYLLEKGANLSLNSNDGRNLLHAASWGGSTAVIEKILSYGIDIDSKDLKGSTPLMLAQRFGKTEVVTYLLSKGAKPS